MKILVNSLTQEGKNSSIINKIMGISNPVKFIITDNLLPTMVYVYQYDDPVNSDLKCSDVEKYKEGIKKIFSLTGFTHLTFKTLHYADIKDGALKKVLQPQDLVITFLKLKLISDQGAAGTSRTLVGENNMFSEYKCKFDNSYDLHSASYVFVESKADAIKKYKFPTEDYISYAAAHELLHQMLLKSYYMRYGLPNPNEDHNNSYPNLNMVECDQLKEALQDEKKIPDALIPFNQISPFSILPIHKATILSYHICLKVGLTNNNPEKAKTIFEKTYKMILETYKKR